MQGTAGLVNINAYSYCVIRETCTVSGCAAILISRQRGYVGTTSRDTVYNHGQTNGYKQPQFMAYFFSLSLQ